MTNRAGWLLLSGALAVVPAIPRSDDDGDVYAQAVADESAAAATPQGAPPSEVPPAPPAVQPPPPVSQRSAGAALPGGQWVYTDQYGWVWMPWSDAYRYVPDDGWGEPYLYVYYPLYGWCWISAPWIWGIGPWPYFGVYGPGRFGWYASGWWREPWRWRYAPGVGGPRGPWRAPPRGSAGGWTSPRTGGFFPRAVPSPRSFGPSMPGGGYGGRGMGGRPGRR